MFRKSPKMKMNSLGTLAVAGLVVLSGCGLDPEPGSVEQSEGQLVQFTSGATTCSDLLAGQTTLAGTVCLSIDNDVDTSATCGSGKTGVLNVTYATTGGWELIQAHLAAGDSKTDIPVNRAGNPQIGQFP